MANSNAKDYWRLLILYGLNTATYKIALGQCLCNFTKSAKTTIPMEMLAKEFFDLYCARLTNNLPQINNPRRLTVMEQVVAKYKTGQIEYAEAVTYVKNHAFRDVIPRFHTLDRRPIDQKFYEATSKGLVLTDNLFTVFADSEKICLQEELQARWSLLESAFAMKREKATLINDSQNFYLLRGTQQAVIAQTSDMLHGYQDGRCFYCGEPLDLEHQGVDHVLPKIYLKDDATWNLVLAHPECQAKKEERLPDQTVIKELASRNERLIQSNQPLSPKVEAALGQTQETRQETLFKIYDQLVDQVGPSNIWSPNLNGQDPFSTGLIPTFLGL